MWLDSVNPFDIMKKEGAHDTTSGADDRFMTLSIGPQYPGSGHMRIVVVVDGDIVVHADSNVGYVHREEEKMS